MYARTFIYRAKLRLHLLYFKNKDCSSSEHQLKNFKSHLTLSLRAEFISLSGEMYLNTARE